MRHPTQSTTDKVRYMYTVSSLCSHPLTYNVLVDIYMCRLYALYMYMYIYIYIVCT